MLRIPGWCWKALIYMRFLFLSFSVFFLSINVCAQQTIDKIEGEVTAFDDQGKKEAIAGANVFWFGSQVGTVTDDKGKFSLKKIKTGQQLVITSVGYLNDTILVQDQKFVEVDLKSYLQLEEVNVVYRRKGIETEFLNPLGVKKVGEKELTKAACCNLSESFETNPTVDVSFTDAITGARQIMMLGLAGPYTQITRESMPDVRGLSSIYGLTFIPGPWIEGIQLIKGTGSVINGFESIAGQINVELKRPETMEKVYLNAYANQEGRIEANSNFKFGLKEHLGTELLLHASSNSFKIDNNEDGFLDRPLLEQYILLNRWDYEGENGLHFEAGAKGTYIDNVGGQVNFKPASDSGSDSIWGMHLLLQRLEGWSKLGKVNQDKPNQSFGLQVFGAWHNQESYYGLNTYNAQQGSIYGNFIFQGIFGNTNHKYRTGISFQYDDYKEELNAVHFDRTEIVPGAFFEYTYSFLEKLNVVAGLRADYHNIFGVFVTPRLHLRYAPSQKTVIRLSAGRGQRTANIISENSGLLASSRQIIIESENDKNPYGLNPEIAWNYGINIHQDFYIDYRHGSIGVDFYRTDFINQIIVDLDKSPQQAIFYNLNGKSFSNSFQVQVDYELIKRLDLRLAYRKFDVQSNYSGEMKSKPLISEDRAFINLGYHTRKNWKFDYTLNWQGSKRIPYTLSNPVQYQLADKSPAFFMMNAQISKVWKNLLEVYVGAENLTGYMQEDPILASDQPFGPYFDSSLIWGPIMGRSFYIGVRFKIK